jgi:hypothetical protein
VRDRSIDSNQLLQEILRAEAAKMVNQDLKDLLPYGLGVHHAGLSKVNDAASMFVRRSFRLPVRSFGLVLCFVVDLGVVCIENDDQKFVLSTEIFQ